MTCELKSWGDYVDLLKLAGTDLPKVLWGPADEQFTSIAGW